MSLEMTVTKLQMICNVKWDWQTWRLLFGVLKWLKTIANIKKYLPKQFLSFLNVFNNNCCYGQERERWSICVCSVTRSIFLSEAWSAISNGAAAQPLFITNYIECSFCLEKSLWNKLHIAFFGFSIFFCTKACLFL